MRKVFIPGWDSPDEVELHDSLEAAKRQVCRDFKESPDYYCGHDICESMTNVIQHVYDLQEKLEAAENLIETMRTIEIWASTEEDPDGEPILLARFEEEEADLIRESAISAWVNESLEKLEKEHGSESPDSATDDQGNS